MTGLIPFALLAIGNRKKPVITPFGDNSGSSERKLPNPKQAKIVSLTAFHGESADLLVVRVIFEMHCAR